MTLVLPAPLSLDNLPAPVGRWLRAAHPEGVPDITSIVLYGPARFRRGRLPWIPIKVWMRHRLGSDHVSDIHVDAGPVTVLRVLDAYVDGRGIMKVAGAAVVGPEVDQGAFHAVWCEAVMFPAAWARLPGFAWEPVDDATARLLLPLGHGVEAVTIRFDATTGFPTSYETMRYKGLDRKVGWRVDYLDWHRFDGMAAPSRVLVTWADEPGPWFEMRVEDVATDVPMDDHLARAREAIQAALASGASRTDRPRWVGPVIGFLVSLAISLAASLAATWIARRLAARGGRPTSAER
jgi:hypothetical protein